MFRKYLLVGGLPDAVKAYLKDKNIVTVREIQNEIQIEMNVRSLLVF